MRPRTVVEFAERSGGEPVGLAEGAAFRHFELDSRSVRPGGLFLAVRGARHDGHDSVGEALAGGCTAAVVERAVAGPHVLVDSLVASLARAARSLRSEFAGPVVGITGSNGKTTTKEFVAAALGALGPVAKSPGNWNTELTSPLTWWESEGASSAVVELAMRGPGQIRHLASFSRPDICIITNVGTAHIEMVGTREGVLRAKSEVFDFDPRAAVLWREDDYFPELAERAPRNLLTFGTSEDADVRVTGYRALAWDRCAVLFGFQGQTAEVELPTLGRHQARNAAAAVAAALHCGVSFPEAVQRLREADLPALRMQRVEHNGATVLLDSYNASPDSMVAAIEAVAELPCSGRRLAVLGTMRELGDYSESGHRRVGAALGAHPLDAVLLVGAETAAVADEALAAGVPRDSIQTMEQVDLSRVRAFLDTVRQGDVAIVKASRSLALEEALCLPSS